MSAYFGFAEGASRHTRNLASAAWVIYSPTGELISSGANCLGPATNNIAEYHAVIGLLTEVASLGIDSLLVFLDSQLVVSHLNRVYTVRDPTLLRLFRRVRLLERSFNFITYQHIPREFNCIADSLANYILDWHLAHT